MQSQALVLIGTVAAVGVLHTMVPDHWLPISLYARTAGWSKAQTARAAAGAGLGHTVSTLLLGLIVWFAGTLAAQRFGHLVSTVSSLALVAFGLWILISSWRELNANGEHGASSDGAHDHRNPHDHQHALPSPRLTLMLILGSSPMVEGIPAFFSASQYGAPLLVVMSLVFAVTTIATYVVLCVGSVAGLQRMRLGAFERYGEVISGALVALIGAVFLFF